MATTYIDMPIGTWFTGQCVLFSLHHGGQPTIHQRLTKDKIYLCQQVEIDMVDLVNDDNYNERCFSDRFEVLHVFTNNKMIELISMSTSKGPYGK
jgi:hypothetical protein